MRKRRREPSAVDGAAFQPIAHPPPSGAAAKRASSDREAGFSFTTRHGVLRPSGTRVDARSLRSSRLTGRRGRSLSSLPPERARGALDAETGRERAIASARISRRLPGGLTCALIGRMKYVERQDQPKSAIGGYGRRRFCRFYKDTAGTGIRDERPDESPRRPRERSR